MPSWSLMPLGVQSMTVPITEMADPLIERFPDMDNTRKGNIMARMRMIVLYDQSAAFSGLVVGTGNKTEILLGYTTLYGDSACAINPLGDLYKTQVRQLSRDWVSRKPSLPSRPQPTCGWVRQMKANWASPTTKSTNCFTCWSISAIPRGLRRCRI